MKNEANELRKKYLLKVYEATEGYCLKSIHCRDLAKELEISNEEENKLYYYLKEKGLVKPLYQGTVTLTTWGVDEVERIMSSNYKEQEYKILKKITEDCRSNGGRSKSDLSESLSISVDDLDIFLFDFEKKKLISLTFGKDGMVEALPKGITTFHKLEKQNSLGHFPLSNITNNTTHIHGSNHGNIQTGGQGNTQKIQIPINPDFDNAIIELLELIKNADIDDDDKELLVNDIKAINNLSQKPSDKNLLEKFEGRIKLLETGLKAADLIGKASPYLPAIYDFFENLFK